MIEVEVKIIGMFGPEFVTVAQKVSLKNGARPKDALEAIYQAGAIDAEVYKQIKGLKPPYFVVLNDQTQDAKPQSIELKNGDSMSVIQLLTGG